MDIFYFFYALRCDVWRAIQWLQMKNIKEKQQWSCCPRKGKHTCGRTCKATSWMKNRKVVIMQTHKECTIWQYQTQCWLLPHSDSNLCVCMRVCVYKYKHLQCLYGWMCLDTYCVTVQVYVCACYLVLLYKETATIFFIYIYVVLKRSKQIPWMRFFSGSELGKVVCQWKSSQRLWYKNGCWVTGTLPLTAQAWN